jgi:hypothetical protein
MNEEKRLVKLSSVTGIGSAERRKGSYRWCVQYVWMAGIGKVRRPGTRKKVSCDESERWL